MSNFLHSLINTHAWIMPRRNILSVLSLLIICCILYFGCQDEIRQPAAPLPSSGGNDPGGTDTSSDSVRAPDFTLLDLDSSEIKLSDYRGRVILLNFWATWCPPCLLEIPHFNELALEYADSGLFVIGISIDQGGEDAVRRFLRETPVNYLVLISENQTYILYQTYLPLDKRGKIPFTFVIDRNGYIRRYFIGCQDKQDFLQAVQPLL